MSAESVGDFTAAISGSSTLGLGLLGKPAVLASWLGFAVVQLICSLYNREMQCSLWIAGVNTGQ